MNKNNLLKQISKQTDLKKKRCESIFNFITGRISKELGSRNEVLISGLGEFKIEREEMKIKIYKNNMKNVIPPKDRINFIPSTELLSKINSQ